MEKMQLFFLVFLFQLMNAHAVSGQACGRVDPGYVWKKSGKSRRIAPIINGVMAEPEAWPWLVAITLKGSSSATCTGFLIDRRHIVSAAHCFFKNPSPTSYAALIGNTDLTKGIRFGFSRIVIHAGYKPAFHYDDIALLTLDRKVRFPGFTPICLPDKKLATRRLANLRMVAAGWGVTQRGKSTSSSRFLMKLKNIPIISNKECYKILHDRAYKFEEAFPKGVPSGLLCTGFASPKSDTCRGDSGGPLMIRARGRFYAVGITSYGFNCGEHGIPSGYTRVSAYLGWIQKNM